MSDEFKNAKIFEPLFQAGCRRVEIQRYIEWGGKGGWRYQVFTDKNSDCCAPAKSVQEAIGNAMKRIKETE